MESSTGTETAPPVGKKEKRFQCQHCQRLFARLEHLQRHERIRKYCGPTPMTDVLLRQQIAG